MSLSPPSDDVVHDGRTVDGRTVDRESVMDEVRAEVEGTTDSEPGSAAHMVLIASTGGSVELSADVLAAMRVPHTRVQIVADGKVRFDGDYRSLSAQGAATEGLAGEHPVERIVRVLTQAPHDEAPERDGN